MKSLLTTEVPAAGPNWRGLLSMYHLDQQLVAHCHVHFSRPPALFTFFVNGHLVTDSGWHLWNPPVQHPQEPVWNSSSTLSIPLNLQNIQKLFPKEHPKYTFIESDSEAGTDVTQYEPEATWLSDPQRYYTFPSGLLLSGSQTKHSFTSQSNSIHTQISSPPTNTLRLNLTCVADVGQLSYKTSAWSSVSLPVVVHPNGLTGSSGSAGLQHILQLIMYILPTLYFLESNGYLT
ncbi:uncharacterized protein LOC123505506 [Portunus trituberculatus]|uniref:uncharacterized protein LOC123505506 n=1 Tax=Portunus trituberculatus TaxID=210409 RepID=UPI001E1CD340|nr:uncharacterized protein LOC123505506 [Portunus trituberculatus]